MAQQNAELHRALNAAFNANDIDAWIALSDPDIELETRFAPLGGETTYRGHHAIRAFYRSLQEVWGDDIAVEAEQYFDIGERTLAFYRLRGRGQQSGAEVAIEATVVATWRDGLCVHWKSYADRQDALRELGFTEDELKPTAASANVELVRSIYAAWERGDYSSTEWAHPEIEFERPDGPDPARAGLSDIADVWRGVLEAWENFRMVPEEYRELDDGCVLVLVRYLGRGRTSGVAIEGDWARGAHVVKLRDGMVIRHVTYFDRDRAFADLGLAPGERK